MLKTKNRKDSLEGRKLEDLYCQVSRLFIKL